MTRVDSEPPEADGSLHILVAKARRRRRRAIFALDVAFHTGPGITAVVGPSGAGKTTLLNCVAGLCTPDAGFVSINGHSVFDSEARTWTAPHRRSISYVFQDLALFPHLSVAHNVGYGLRRLDQRIQRTRIEEILESFGIPHLLSCRPNELSGGERQRVALARALVTRPQALLLDEPTSSLDTDTKTHIMADLRHWVASRPIPVLYVTHDHHELLSVAQRVVRLEQGQVASGPSEVGPLCPSRDSRPDEVSVVVLASRESDGTRACRISGTDVVLRLTGILAPVGSTISVPVHAGQALGRPEGVTSRP